MADSTISTALDVTKMKVVDLRKELKARGLSYSGDKSELVNRLQTAMAQDQDDHGDINLDSDEIDSDGVLEEDEKLDDDDDKSQDLLDESAVDPLTEELALAEPAPAAAAPAPAPKPARTLKRKITADKEPKGDKDTGSKKIVLNRAISITAPKPAAETTDSSDSKPAVADTPSDKIKITADIDPKTRLEMRAKRFGLPVKVPDDVKKEARKQRFGQSTDTGTKTTITGPASLSENIDKLKKRSERFGQSVSKIMTDIELKERIEKRKAKFGMVK